MRGNRRVEGECGAGNSSGDGDCRGSRGAHARERAGYVRLSQCAACHEEKGKKLGHDGPSNSKVSEKSVGGIFKRLTTITKSPNIG